MWSPIASGPGDSDWDLNFTTVKVPVRREEQLRLGAYTGMVAVRFVKITWNPSDQAYPGWNTGVDTCDTATYYKGKGAGSNCGELDPMMQTSKAKGDPHVTNIHGDRFDINTAGMHTFLQIPRGHAGPSSTAELSVWGKVDAPGENCKVMWIHEVNIAGTRVGGEYQVQAQATPKDQSSDLGIFLLTAGNVSTTNPNKFASVFPNAQVQLYPKKVSEWARRKHNNMHIASIKFPIGLASLDLDLWKTKTPHPWLDRFPGTAGNNHIDLNVQSLAVLSSRDNVGGLLGSDDHSSASECKSSTVHAEWQHGTRKLFEVEEDDGSSSVLSAAMLELQRLPLLAERACVFV
jgi:hypothetical protein